MRQKRWRFCALLGVVLVGLVAGSVATGSSSEPLDDYGASGEGGVVLLAPPPVSPKPEPGVLNDNPPEYEVEDQSRSPELEEWLDP